MSQPPDLDPAGGAPSRPLRGTHALGSPSLSEYEARGAGHTLARHVHDEHGQYATDAERLAADPHIPASGGFLDAATAQSAVDDALTLRRDRVDAWRPGATRYTPFIAEVALDSVVGGNLTREDFARGVTEPTATTGVRFVLMPDAEYACGFAVLTAYNVIVPPPPTRHIGLSAAWRALDAPQALALTRLDAPAQFATGARSAARFLSDAVADAALEAALDYWSADIDAWLAGAAEPNALTRAFVAESTVGLTLQRPELERGEPWTETPALLFTLTRDASRPEGFRVTKVMPGRSF